LVSFSLTSTHPFRLEWVMETGHDCQLQGRWVFWGVVHEPVARMQTVEVASVCHSWEGPSVTAETGNQVSERQRSPWCMKWALEQSPWEGCCQTDRQLHWGNPNDQSILGVVAVPITWCFIHWGKLRPGNKSETPLDLLGSEGPCSRLYIESRIWEQNFSTIHGQRPCCLLNFQSIVDW
jgi:hypothetical protein